MRPRARYSRGRRSPRGEWRGAPESVATVDGHELRVRQVGGRGRAIIEYEALVDGEPVGRDLSYIGARYVAEDELLARGDG